ncbi:MAG: hypothetical protein JOZ45_12400 [Acidobacteriaceae bacterium]|nr:hypothetical protein [Acidobacteriaceae bacterium]MBV9306938.1 hypothetical protein [Acidobacteriaceae bacterium]
MRRFSRRHFLFLAGVFTAPGQGFSIEQSDDDFLEDLSRRAFLFFWEQSDPKTGLVLDRVRGNGSEIGGYRHLNAASTAATGFYLTAFCIGHQRRWADRNEIRERVRSCLMHLAYSQEHVRGWFYHFVNRKDGGRIWNSEVSSIDTALLLAGVITAQQYFQKDPFIPLFAAQVFERVDFPWMLDERTGCLRMGWKPETGFLRAEWVDYRENAILHMLAVASPVHPVPTRCWYGFERDQIELAGYRFVGRGPIFTHQYSEAWLYLRGLRDGPPFEIDYFQNSVTATYALRALCLSLRGIYPSFSENLWGVSPSDSDIGYVSWGEPASRHDIDGTVVPCAAGGSLMFAPEICLPALRYMHSEFGEYIYGRYGFVDAFHPLTLWVNPDVVGINLGITLLSAENLRTGNVWRWFGQSSDVQRAIEQIFARAG